MICPHCKGNDTIVVDSRIRNGIVKRRRMCMSCKQRFNTLEVSEEILRPWVESNHNSLGAWPRETPLEAQPIER